MVGEDYEITHKTELCLMWGKKKAALDFRPICISAGQNSLKCLPYYTS